MSIRLERIYEDTPHNGYRVLVDRLWPRGIKKSAADLDEWCKDIAPSPGLRKWFGHKPERWTEFQKRYTKELREHKDEARDLLKRAGRKSLVLLYGAKDSEHTHAIVLKKFLARL